MLNEVLQLAHGQGWFDLSQPYEKTVYLSQGASLWMVLSRQGRPNTFVKFSTLVTLQAEAARCSLASQWYPDYAPRFLGHSKRDALEVLATQALDFRALTVAMMQTHADARALSAGLQAYFHCMARNVPASNVDRHGWLANMRSYFSGRPTQAAAEHGLGRLAEVIDLLPPMPQHGDLVMNNLGLTPERRLVIIDWEDYGAVELPGLDLFTLEFSFAKELGRPFPPTAGATITKALDVQRCCAALHLDPKLYEDLRLSYALTFRYLKRQYGPDIQDRLDQLILRLAARG